MKAISKLLHSLSSILVLMLTRQWGDITKIWFCRAAPNGPLSSHKLMTFHPDTRCSQTEPEATVWKPNWTLCDSLSRAILSAHYLTLVPVKTRCLRFDFEPPSLNRSLVLPLSFHLPFGFYKEAGPRFSPEARLHHLRQLPAVARLRAKENPGNCAANHFSRNMPTG